MKLWRVRPKFIVLSFDGRLIITFKVPSLWDLSYANMCYNIVWGGQVLYIIPREARREAPSRVVYNLFACEARVYPSSIGQQWQGHRDFILAISLSSLVGVRLDVIQSSDVRVHYGFPGNRLPSTIKLWVFFLKLWIITMYTVGESPPNISGK